LFLKESKPPSDSHNRDPNALITSFQGTDLLPAGEFSEGPYLGGYSLWLTGDDYKVTLQGRFENNDPSVFILHAIPIELGSIPREAAEMAMISYILETQPQIRAIRLQIRPPKRLDIHTNYDFRNQEALDFAAEFTRKYFSNWNRSI